MLHIDPPIGSGGGCPEQYSVHDDNGNLIGSLYLRHGVFTVEYEVSPDDRILWVTYPKGDGNFFEDERDYYIENALNVIDEYHFCRDIIRPGVVQEPINSQDYISNDENSKFYNQTVLYSAAIILERLGFSEPNQTTSFAVDVISRMLIRQQRDLIKYLTIEEYKQQEGEQEYEKRVSRIKSSIHVLEEMLQIADGRLDENKRMMGTENYDES